MKIRKILCTAAVLLLLVSTCTIVQAVTNTDTASLPVVLPGDDDICLSDKYLTLDTLLTLPDSATIKQDYVDTLLSQYDGVMVQAQGSINLWAAPNSDTLICSLTNGTVLHLLDMNNGWYKVLFDNTVGYFRTEYAIPVVYADYEKVPAVQTSAPVVAEIAPVVPSVTVDPDLSQVPDIRQRIADSAMNWIGVPYLYGGSSTGGTDCSGFTMSIFAQYGYGLYHGAGSQYSQCCIVTDQQRDVGDLVFFNWGGGISHVGIYLGGGTFVHASTSSGVIVSSLSESYYANGYVGAGRILPD